MISPCEIVRLVISSTQLLNVGSFPSAKKLRSSLSHFNWRECCFFCGEEIKIDLKHPNRNKPVFEAVTLTFRTSIWQLCEKRNDSWAETVKIRLNDCIDLPAAEGIYHKTCQVKFMAEKQLHNNYSMEWE